MPKKVRSRRPADTRMDHAAEARERSPRGSRRYRRFHHKIIHKIPIADRHIFFFCDHEAHPFVKLASLVIAIYVEPEDAGAFRPDSLEDKIDHRSSQTFALLAR